MTDIKNTLKETKAYACLDCGKCTSACPISRYDQGFSPRMLVYDAIHESDLDITEDGRLWQCVTCASCETICASGVQYRDFITSIRQEAYEKGVCGDCTHGGALQALMHIMANDDMQQNRLDWLPKELRTSTTSDTLYFVGCSPYFDAFFSDLKVKTLRASKGVIALLNQMEIEPALLPNERCCGHDLLNSGDVDGFLNLARRNVDEIKATGAKRVVVSCPEGYYTLKEEYPRHLGDTGFEIVHIMELAGDAVSNGNLVFSKSKKKKVAYHDPCRLGRISGIYDEPRMVLEAIPGVEIVEMAHHRSNALCCGTQSWINCGAINKQIQVELLREAKATGAEILLTACPKCQIHLRCAMKDDDELKIDIQDIASFVAGALAR